MKNVVGRIWSLTCVWDRWRITEISGIREKKIRIIRLFMADSVLKILVGVIYWMEDQKM